ncbi:glycosyltransferase [Nostoc sp. FACHB-152]|uniref:glycosyltransferase n=1 Tax=unclassified Nostoc TaxID=2593658 RepID=UPI00168999D1|nr:MULTISPECIES: glycosyltransferase [unclassified Nostoc]MBD2448463.1 glycosyltransferase [Nostoc sp. FACHB-152]MBD2466200.1 glycosyltransferase [Nostoc sp. FACHB-145]
MSNISSNSPIISVIIPAYNSEKTIKSTIDSVLNQTFKNFELIVINDGSTDSTLNIISQIQDHRLKVFSFDNAGGNISRNRGLHQAVGEFVSFLDADDIWTTDKLASQLEALQANTDAKVAYSWTDYIDENGKFLVAGNHLAVNGDVYERLLVSNFLENGSNPLIYREALVELGGFDESLKAAQDWDMWLRLAAKYSFICVPEVQILYRVSANSLSTHLDRQEKACLQVLKGAYNTRPLVSKNIWNLSLANLYKYLVCKALQEPFNRQKGITAARFLWLFIINDAARSQRINFTLKILLKIIIIIALPPNLSTALVAKKNFKNFQSQPFICILIFEYLK